ncbi:MAG: SIMPL domain-containing protein [Rhodobacteraceae bacterium]|nr:SIMPL domain-containing protein [Paracoccaceae bacterium]
MKARFAIVPLLAACLAMPVLASEGSERQIRVTGQGTVETVPDMAVITLGVTNEHREALTAMDMTSTAVNRILVKLTELGVEPRDMQTSQLALNPVWSTQRFETGNRTKITGFSAVNTVFVRVRNLDGLGHVLDAVISEGANNFNGLQFALQDPKRAVEEARARAVANAADKASQLAAAAGLVLGDVLTMSEQLQHGRPGVPMEMMAARAADVPIAAGEVGVSVVVDMVFEIEDIE